MLVSYNWLKQYVQLPVSLKPEELALKLTMSAVEVEGVVNQGKNLENITVGQIKKIIKHPNADKLKLVDVNIGKENVRVVCGGTNLREGMLVAFGKVSAKVRWHGKGELVELQKTKIRGEESAGMICAADEIGLAEMFPKKEEFEILDLTKKLETGNWKLGAPLSLVLGLDDVIFEIDNKSMTHRPDLWGHYGLAREIAALYGVGLGEYSPPLIEDQKACPERSRRIKRSKDQMKLKVNVEEKELCPRYMGVVIDNVKVGSSPEWLQKKLLAVGLRPINNVVDITNYLMMDLAQPMHAFDAKHVTCNMKHVTTIAVRKAEKGEKILALDGREYELTKEMLVIADEKKPIAIAGVIGGEETGVDEKTTTIIFEAANFDATSVRRTAMALGIRTDSSARFEKSLDPNNAELALRRAVQLILEICPEARVASRVADEYHAPFRGGMIDLDLEFLNKKIGMEIPKKKVVEILESLGFSVADKKDHLSVSVPTWRATKDISIAEDLVEEVARIYGYGNVAVSLPVFPVAPPERNELRLLERKIKDILSLEYGFVETLNYSFTSPQLLQKLDIDSSLRFANDSLSEGKGFLHSRELGRNDNGVTANYIELANPLDKSRPYLRRSLLPGLLENLENNLHRFDEARLFEIGKVFLTEEPGDRTDKNGSELLPRQDSMLGLVYAGKGDDNPFYAVSHSLTGALERLGYEVKLEKRNDIATHLHPGRQATLVISDHVIGMIGEIHPVNQKNLGLEIRAAAGTVNLNKLLELFAQKSGYKPGSPYPAVTRDIAFVVPRDIEHAAAVAAIKKADPLIIEVELFDVFEGKNIPAGKKSLAYHIVYQAGDRTLAARDVDAVHVKVEKMLGEKFGAGLRK
ncbi:MAG: phenylalanine--tRNA ligase subunit beta [Patescibacteria group bacterium]